MTVHPCHVDSCGEWVELGADAHEVLDLDDGFVTYCLRHCPICSNDRHE